MAMTVIPAMVSIYADLVKAGVRKIETIPEIYQEPVKDYIESKKGL